MCFLAPADYHRLRNYHGANLFYSVAVLAYGYRWSFFIIKQIRFSQAAKDLSQSLFIVQWMIVGTMEDE